MCKCEIMLSWKEENLYLDRANMQPFMDPKQDKATNTGTTTEKLPITLSAKVCDGREEEGGCTCQSTHWLLGITCRTHEREQLLAYQSAEFIEKHVVKNCRPG